VTRLLEGQQADIISLEEGRELWRLGTGSPEEASWEEERASFSTAPVGVPLSGPAAIFQM